MTPYAFVLAVPDLERSAGYYRDVLGFQVFWEDAEGWRILKRDAVQIMIGACPDDRPASEIGSHSWFGYVNVPDVAALRDEIQARGAACTALRDQPYGMREMVVTTIDGHRIVFGQETGASAAAPSSASPAGGQGDRIGP